MLYFFFLLCLIRLRGNKQKQITKLIALQGGGDVVIEAAKLLKKYFEITYDEIDLTIAVVADRNVQIEVSFENDNRSEKEKVRFSYANIIGMVMTL